MGRRKRNNKSTSSSVELARASIDAGGQPLQTTEQSAQQDVPVQLPKAMLQKKAVADQDAKNIQEIKAKLSQLRKEHEEGLIVKAKAAAELKVAREAAMNILSKLKRGLEAPQGDTDCSLSFSFPTVPK